MPELKLNIDEKFDQTLSDYVDSSTGANTKADVVQRAVSTYKYFRSIKPGQKIQIVNPDGSIAEQDLKLP